MRHTLLKDIHCQSLHSLFPPKYHETKEQGARARNVGSQDLGEGEGDVLRTDDHRSTAGKTTLDKQQCVKLSLGSLRL